MRKLVVDSSIIVKWLNKQNEERLTQADAILRDAQFNKVSLLTCELAKYEVGNALLIKKQLTLKRAKNALATLYSLPITFISESEDLAKMTYNLGLKYGNNKITYYDASFAALAEREKAILITDNPKHQGVFKEIQVVSLKNYR